MYFSNTSIHLTKTSPEYELLPNNWLSNYWGAVHLLLKRYISGVILTLITFTAIYLQLSEIMETIAPIMAQIQRGEIAPNISVITASLAQASANSSIPSILLIIWLVAIVDAYRIGKK